ncbi:hypothetical protein BDA99DRAFT_40870 [Phascolomyces articulosus]|uniref:Uncharacterized protein n=1 Tax=Phascolomyces articulosus TaxID=60185 RepID=A0AAD5PEU0_9FUNG|nr:hypothetical protein BDA99DRAFT_40870 [Phascolomyces articulosus]
MLPPHVRIYTHSHPLTFTHTRSHIYTHAKCGYNLAYNYLKCNNTIIIIILATLFSFFPFFLFSFISHTFSNKL